MASVPAVETPTSIVTVEVPKSPLTIRPFEMLVSKNVIDTPPDSPVAGACLPASSTALDTAKGTPRELLIKRPQISGVDAENEDSDGSDHSFENVQLMAAQSNMANTKVEKPKTSDNHITTPTNGATTVEVHSPVANIKNKVIDEIDLPVLQSSCNTHDEPAANNERCEAQPEQPSMAQVQPLTECEVSSGSAEDRGEDKDGQLDDTIKDTSAHSVTGKDETGCDTEDGLLEDDEDTAVDTPEQFHGAPQSPSVPPHIRHALRASSSQSTLGSRPSPTTLSISKDNDICQREWTGQLPRASRIFQPGSSYQPFRPPPDHHEFQRAKAHLMKALDDLEAERAINAEMRTTICAEKEASFGAAMSEMLTDLLQKQAGALMAKAKTEKKDRELQCREQQISRLEVYLSEGQKQLKYRLEQHGIRSMSEVDEANVRREIELTLKHQLSDVEGNVASEVERLRHQEAAQKVREQQYKVLIRETLENEIREKLAHDMHDKIAASKTADSNTIQAAYEHGLIEGKKAGCSRVPESVGKDQFLRGYATCHRSQTALHNMRTGSLATDSPELAFLYDPTHAENPHNIGLSIGRMAAETPQPSSVGLLTSRASSSEGAARTTTITAEPRAISNPVTLHGRGQAQFIDSSSSQTPPAVDRSERVHPAQQARPLQVQQEESVRKSVPPRATFAGELRGSASTPPSDGVFASRSNAPTAPTAPRSTIVNISNNIPKAGIARHVGQGIYAGRRLIRYEDADDEPTSPNLIDLY